MAATFRSQFRRPPKEEETSWRTQRKNSSRIPTKQSSSNDVKPSNTKQHASKLAKRASGSITPSDKPEYGTKGTEKASAPMIVAHNPPAASKRTSVTPFSDVNVAGVPLPATSRPNGYLPPPPTMRTPSLVSGSSASTFDSPKTNGLRRKPSTIGSYAASKRVEQPVIEADGFAMRNEDVELDEAFEDSVLGISLPKTATKVHHDTFVAANPKYRFTQYAYSVDQPMTRDITPPVPYYAQSATPSTRYTDSPFSHVPTPSSTSSYSPAVVSTTSGTTPRLRQPSPTYSRPPIASKPNDKKDSSRLGLPPVRESSTSSSNSTVKPYARSAIPKEELPRKPATAPPPSKTPDAQPPASRGKLTKDKTRQLPTATVRAPIQVPPELAHLNVEPPSKLSLNKALPPIRPSREGTPNLTGMTHPSPVVQSDLPSVYTTYHKRTPSQESQTVTSPLKSRFALSPKSSSRHQSPRIDSAISPPPASRTFARGPTPDTVPVESQRLTRKDSPAVGTVRSPSKSPRFGFFSRKPKPEALEPPEKPKRQPSKGPVAGTGHEGYGRIGLRGRSGSSASSTGLRSQSSDSNSSSLPKRPSTDRKNSTTSKEGSEMDQFLRTRLNPVVLRGSGSTTSNWTSSADNTPRSAPDSSKSSSLDLDQAPRLLPSAISEVNTSQRNRYVRGVRAPSVDSSEDDATARYPTLAARRSLNRLSQGDGKSSVKMPAPIVTTLPSKNSSLDSYDAEFSVWPWTDTSVPAEDPFEGKEGLWLRTQPATAEVKAPRKWNFFQRAQASPRPKSKGKEKATDATQVPSHPAHPAAYSTVAHYAMLDQVEPVGLEEVERMMQENETSAEDSMSDSNAPPKVVPYERRHTGLLPSPPKPEFSRDFGFRTGSNLPRTTIKQDRAALSDSSRAPPAIQQHGPRFAHIQRPLIIPDPEGDQGASEKSLPELPKARKAVHTPEITQGSLNTPENPSDNSPHRQPRLSPVGRIPKVISKRDRDRKLSDISFSRPFVRAQPRPIVKPPGSLYTQIRELASPIESGSQPVSSTSTRSDGGSGEHKSSVNTDPPTVSTNRTSMEIHANNEFFAFPPRKDSDISYSTSSGNNSWIAALAAPAPQEEDIWHEYNDLLDDVMPQRTPLSACSSLGAPFQYSSVLREPNTTAYPDSFYHCQPPPTNLPPPPRSHTVPAVLNVPQQIARFMRPSMSPLTTPQALPDFFGHYGNRSTSTSITPNRTSVPGPKRSSLAQSTHSSIPGPNRSSLAQTTSQSSLPSARGSVSSSRYSRASGHSRSASLPEANARNSQSSLTSSARFNRDTQLLDIAEVDGDDQAAAANLRFGALMTSKWLSFGRVLFSPAHNEMRLSDQPRVLVVDGLGSDWSYYVALSYPGATVYNLGPSSLDGSTTWPGVTQKPPSNHRHINHAGISASFPFPKGFFTAVVFRFPLVTTNEAYQACIFECKRVLRPGGYLEVAVLDLDLMNMGNKARKAVRGLKTRMQEKNHYVSLQNLSDVLVRLIGRRGFEEVQRCIVGVPAAGRIPRSQDMSSVSSGTSGKPIWHREDRGGHDFSFADLLEDARASQIGPGKNNDESLTKMVSKVGRWWYSTCYERPLLQSENYSIWNDPTLLRECERQGTSFRLLICHAQKPTQTKRRTMSV